MILETATALVCMANAIYFESRSQSTVGQIAVGQVIMNRVSDYRFPGSVCEVVTDGLRYKWNNQMVLHKCAFSFYCDGKPEHITDHEAYQWAEQISFGILNNTLHIDLTDGSTHYHAHYVKPSWSDHFTKTVRINDHIFYRWEME
jgi:spore germination cell wall hydrolase CwlJ-like protein